jgi:hypothetical protein
LYIIIVIVTPGYHEQCRQEPGDAVDIIQSRSAKLGLAHETELKNAESLSRVVLVSYKPRPLGCSCRSGLFHLIATVLAAGTDESVKASAIYYHGIHAFYQYDQ